MGTARLIMVAALMSCLPPTTCGQVAGKGHRSEMVRFKSTLDGSLQPAIIHIPRENRDNPVPLLVMLHTWGSSFATNYAAESLAECDRNGWDWAAIEPYYRGPNDQAEACASEMAVQDVLDAIQYAKTRISIDLNRIYTAGISGGGHMAMILAGRAPHVWAGVSAWVGQADLAGWYHEMKAWPNPIFWHYWVNLEAICGGPPGSSPEIDEQYRLRSPLTHLPNAGGVAIDINAGIDDGHTGCVPISHSLRAFNVLAVANGRPQQKLTTDQIESLAQRREIPNILALEPVDEPGRRHRVLLRRQAGPVRLTVFEGGHEGDMPAATRWLATQSKNTVDSDPGRSVAHPDWIHSASTAAVPARDRYSLRNDQIVESTNNAGFGPGILKEHPNSPNSYVPLAKDRPGFVVTRPIPCNGNQLRITADAGDGVIRVGVLTQPLFTVEDYDTGKHKKVGTDMQTCFIEDEIFSVKQCEPITKDVSDKVVHWKGGSRLDHHYDRLIQLRFKLENAAIYSFRFVDEPHK